jgi:hypothetical protein
MPCFFASDVYIKVGADLENKHRGMYVMTRVVVVVCRVLFEVFEVVLVVVMKLVA